MGGKAAPLLVGGAMIAGSVTFAMQEWNKELPIPCQVLQRHLASDTMQEQLGFQVIPWSFKFWHGQVNNDFARLSVPLFGWIAVLPCVTSLEVPRRRSELYAAMEKTPTGEWRIINLLEDPKDSERAVKAPTPKRTDDIMAAETGQSVWSGASSSSTKQ
mmetsp:Transcript_20622/g.30725  ORF Transcript_20622/g.30725 Transcript_20622/m.30725 type:complete len:159 (+) Transcript_20622:2-478(+)